MPRFESIRGLFLDGPRNLKPRSNEEDDTDQGPTLQTSTPNLQKDVWSTTSDLTYTISMKYVGILEYNRVLYFEQSGTETETTKPPRPTTEKKAINIFSLVEKTVRNKYNQRKHLQTVQKKPSSLTLIRTNLSLQNSICGCMV
ncbi:hypothetical protein AVEN_149547-1 [Araneus ventricosus]|uniref:Uncharacterized protein n=1 Tax=Araneus ventricosus TaxID=182803 RepID=A0A4Y2JUV7_ARAVE|nr:hypothetical protein AVEN_149547-1 [Araneus ventricosus]